MPALDPATVELRSPIKSFGKDVTQLVISREVNGADLRAVDGLRKNAALLRLIERLYRTPDGKSLSTADVDKLSFHDIRALEAAMAPFAGYGLEELTDEDEAETEDASSGSGTDS